MASSTYPVQDTAPAATVLTPASSRPSRPWSGTLKTLTVASLAVLAAACGKAPQGGFSGMPPAQVVVQPATARDIAIDYEYVAQTAGSREVEIRARVNGIVEKRLYEEGSVVKAGQPLFKLDAAPYAAAVAQAEAAVASAEANARQAEREYSRLKPLIEVKAVSQREWDQAQSALDIARAQVKEAQARLAAARVDLGYTQIAAPISGVVGRALKVEGALANATGGDSLLATLAQTDPLHVNFAIAEKDKSERDAEIAAGSLKLPKGGYSVKLKTSEGRSLPQSGTIDFTDYKADANTGAYAARATVGNSAGLLTPGQFVRVVLTGATRPNAIVVPQRAVLDGPMGKFVYLVGKGQDGKPAAEPRPVVPGEWVSLDGKEKNGWVIRQGLNVGDPVVIDGMARIFAPGQPLMPMSPEEAAKAAAAQPAGAPGKPGDAPAAAKPAEPTKPADRPADQPAAKK
ncbi:MAG: efflux RND transporter periplasmic adaptor subunit [Burkholderiales bacterium]|nr:efflux RND transporter periplasmic adaptor subunit [Burkholderiales bacterium]